MLSRTTAFNLNQVPFIFLAYGVPGREDSWLSATITLYHHKRLKLYTSE